MQVCDPIYQWNSYTSTECPILWSSRVPKQMLKLHQINGMVKIMNRYLGSGGK